MIKDEVPDISHRDAHQTTKDTVVSASKQLTRFYESLDYETYKTIENEMAREELSRLFGNSPLMANAVARIIGLE